MTSTTMGLIHALKNATASAASVSQKALSFVSTYGGYTLDAADNALRRAVSHQELTPVEIELLQDLPQLSLDSSDYVLLPVLVENNVTGEIVEVRAAYNKKGFADFWYDHHIPPAVLARLNNPPGLANVSTIPDSFADLPRFLADTQGCKDDSGKQLFSTAVVLMNNTARNFILTRDMTYRFVAWGNKACDEKSYEDTQNDTMVIVGSLALALLGGATLAGLAWCLTSCCKQRGRSLNANTESAPPVHSSPRGCRAGTADSYSALASGAKLDQEEDERGLARTTRQPVTVATASPRPS